MQTQSKLKIKNLPHMTLLKIEAVFLVVVNIYEAFIVEEVERT